MEKKRQKKLFLILAIIIALIFVVLILLMIFNGSLKSSLFNFSLSRCEGNSCEGWLGSLGLFSEDCNNNGIWEKGETLENCPNDCTEYCDSPPDEINVLDTGDYIVGSYIMPGWYVGGSGPTGQPMIQSRTEFIWDKIINNFPRVDGADQPLIPLVNPYEDSNPISMDWTIKWGLENGVSLFVYDWFWYNGTNWFNNSESLEQAFLKSKYINNSNYPVKFAVMWTNVYDYTYPQAMEKDRLAPFKHVIENYFKHPNYLKIDGKPVFYIMRPENLPVSKYVRASYEDGGKYGPQIEDRQYITDGLKDNNYSSINSVQSNCLELNLGKSFNISGINIWHKPGRTYKNPRVLVSTDKVDWIVIYNGEEYLETAEGKNYSFDWQQVKYVRDCINGSYNDSRNYWGEIEVWGNNTQNNYINFAANLFNKEQIELNHTIQTFRDMAMAEGFEGIYFVNVGSSYPWQDPLGAIENGIDALSAYYYSPPGNTTLNGTKYTSYEDLISYYETMWEENYKINNKYFPLITPGYDDTMKAKWLGKLITNSSPDKFKILAQNAKNFVDNKSISPKIIMVKAWNEWPESSVLAPTKKWGFGYLNAIRDVFGKPSCIKTKWDNLYAGFNNTIGFIDKPQDKKILCLDGNFNGCNYTVSDFIIKAEDRQKMGSWICDYSNQEWVDFSSFCEDNSLCYCGGADFNRDGSVNGIDLSFMSSWFGGRQGPCNEENNWCGGVDMQKSGVVDGTDLSNFRVYFKRTDCNSFVEVAPIGETLTTPAESEPIDSGGSSGGGSSSSGDASITEFEQTAAALGISQEAIEEARQFENPEEPVKLEKLSSSRTIFILIMGLVIIGVIVLIIFLLYKGSRE
jgi:hypothetical protein